jgi:Immunoglobulin I-set domain
MQVATPASLRMKLEQHAVLLTLWWKVCICVWKLNFIANILVLKLETVFPPVIARRLQAQVLKVGERARMEVEVAGTPSPTVTWHKDGVQITTDSLPGLMIKQIGDFNYLIFEQGTLCSQSWTKLLNQHIILVAVTASHGGQYSVTATNCGGRAQSIADVAVVEARPEISLEVTKLVFEDIEEEVSFVFCVTFQKWRIMPRFFFFSLSIGVGGDGRRDNWVYSERAKKRRTALCLQNFCHSSSRRPNLFPLSP